MTNIKSITKEELDSLNSKYKNLDPKSRIEDLLKDFQTDKILLTSSFGATSIMLIHMFNQVNPNQVVYFINTTYHFNETLDYRNLIIERFGLNVKELKAGEYENRFTREYKAWEKNPNICCFINKVDPFNRLKPKHDVWVSGLIGFQNTFRKELNIFEKTADIIKFHPLIDLSKNEVANYIKMHDLPIHPLVNKGYDSIGCKHCSIKGQGRTGRWLNNAKTECGLHV